MTTLHPNQYSHSTESDSEQSPYQDSSLLPADDYPLHRFRMIHVVPPRLDSIDQYFPQPEQPMYEEMHSNWVAHNFPPSLFENRFPGIHNPSNSHEGGSNNPHSTESDFEQSANQYSTSLPGDYPPCGFRVIHVVPTRVGDDRHFPQSEQPKYFWSEQRQYNCGNIIRISRNNQPTGIHSIASNSREGGSNPLYQRLKKHFQRYDSDGDGRLSGKELEWAFAILGSRWSWLRAWMAMRYADENGDGYISNQRELHLLIRYTMNWMEPKGTARNF